MTLPEWFTERGYGGTRELSARGFFTLFATGTLAVLLVVGGLCLAGTAYSCSQLGHQTGHPTTYRIMSGCYINLPGLGWVPRDQWQNVNLGPRP